MLYSNFYIKNNQSLIPKYNVKIYNFNQIVQQETKALINRLYIQSYRRPSNLIAGIIQPLLWLILFGALFKNIPINFIETYDIKYTQFLSYGMISFTAFNSSINSGLPIIFDREFGFLNRLIASPLISLNTLFISLIIYILIISNVQIIVIILLTAYKENTHNILQINNIVTIISITTLMVINISNISIYMSLILPGHIEFLALTLILNLPILFSSTALAPLSFMPLWLQILACINPLTYTVEIIRNICTNQLFNWNIYIINTTWIQINLQNCIFIIIITNILSFIIINKIIKYKYN